MRNNHLVDTMFNMWVSAIESGQPQQTVCLLGPPGIGKTMSGRQLAERMTAYMQAKHPRKEGEPYPAATCRINDLSSMLPEDLLGLPFRKGGLTQYCPHEWLAQLCEPEAYGVLVLDDLPASPPALQVASRQLSLERRVHDHHLSDRVFIIVTGNRREDKSAASTLPAHFRNSVLMLEVQPDLEEWATWYGKQPYHHPMVPAFLRWKVERLSTLPKDADKRGVFATPRTWTMLGRQYEVAQRSNALLEIARGLVGEGIASEFKAFIDVRAELVPPDKVLRDPKAALPNPRQQLNSIDRMIAMSTALGEVAAVWTKEADAPDKSESSPTLGGPEGDNRSNRKKRAQDAPLQLLRALSWVTAHQREYVAAGIYTYLNNGGNQTQLVKVAMANNKDPLVGGLLQHLKKVFNERKEV